MARLAALCGLLGLLAAIAGPFLLLIALGLHIPILGISFGTAVFTIAIVEEIIGVIAAGAALTLISMVRTSWRSTRSASSSRASEARWACRSSD